MSLVKGHQLPFLGRREKAVKVSWGGWGMGSRDRQQQWRQDSQKVGYGRESGRWRSGDVRCSHKFRQAAKHPNSYDVIAGMPQLQGPAITATG